jgi:hypothetical protein
MSRHTFLHQFISMVSPPVLSQTIAMHLSISIASLLLLYFVIILAARRCSFSNNVLLQTPQQLHNVSQYCNCSPLPKQMPLNG